MTKAHVIVHSRLHVEEVSTLHPDFAADLRAQFTHANPEHERWSTLPPNVRRWKPEPRRTIATWRDELGDVLSLPRGGTVQLRAVAKAHGVVLEFDDRRSSGDIPAWDRVLRHDLNLFAFQEEMVIAALKYENCLLRAPCGAGKTSVGVAIAARVGVSTLIVVPSTRIFDEWVKRLGFELGLMPDEIGWFGRGKKRIRPITVATIDTLKRHVAEVAPMFGCVIFDEVHRAPAASYYPAIDALPCCYRIGVSADEKRKDRMHGIGYDLFGAVAVDVDQELLYEQGVVYPVAVRLVPTSFKAPWYTRLSDQAKRNPAAYKRLLDQIVDDDARTRIAVQLAADACVRRPALVFSHRVQHCASMRAEILSALSKVAPDLRVGVVLGDPVYKAESDETVAGLQAGTHRCGVGTYQSIGTGIDLPGVEVGVAVTPILANRQNFRQVRDRLCRVDRRPGATKRHAVLYVLWDADVLGERPLRNAFAWNGGRVEVLDGDDWIDGREYLHRRAPDMSLLPGGAQ